jgi:hypothetical protein
MASYASSDSQLLDSLVVTGAGTEEEVVTFGFALGSKKPFDVVEVGGRRTSALARV